MDGAHCTVYGRPLDNVDLTYILHHHERVLIEEPEAPDEPVRVVVGPPNLSSPDPAEMASDERLAFITWCLLETVSNLM
jgi:hypothetical protein